MGYDAGPAPLKSQATARLRGVGSREGAVSQHPKDPERAGWAAGMAEGSAEAGKWLSVPIGFVFWLTVFALLGRWADHHFDTEPWLQLAGIAVGLPIAFVYLFYAVKVARRRES